MRKKIQRPENWQDFESLCRMLWGEIWGIEDKIKKNGRLGQPQAGVDVYGVPKGKTQYSGIQCKGKDDFLKNRLTKDEIDKEIVKAKTFLPKLETFIIATTAEKDVNIERYIREKDLESRLSGNFEILLFDWEDISDRIEVHGNTFNYYVLNNQFKSNFDFELLFDNGLSEITVTPKYKRLHTKYGLVGQQGFEEAEEYPNLKSIFKSPLDIFSHSKESWENLSWIKLGLQFTNTGNRVIEDYKMYISPKKENIRKFVSARGGSLFFPLIQTGPFWTFDEEKYGTYHPLGDNLLIQKDGRSFECHLLLNHGAREVFLEYELLARDFNKVGTLKINVMPEITDEIKLLAVTSKWSLREDEISYEDFLIRIDD